LWLFSAQRKAAKKLMEQYLSEVGRESAVLEKCDAAAVNELMKAAAICDRLLPCDFDALCTGK
jgi:hypothetical protein